MAMADGGCALVLLAAGASLRLGRPKQLLEVAGEPLIRRMARIATEARLFPSVVVLGAHSAQIRAVLADLPLQLVENPAWEEGMASSLRAGISAVLQQAPHVHGAIVMLADQPHVTATHLANIEQARRSSGRSIVATHYGDHSGPPACFSREHFPALQNLRCDVGARGLLRAFDAHSIPAPPGMSIDVDTAADAVRLIESPPVSR